MRTAATIIAVAINIMVFVSLLAFMIDQIEKEKIPAFSTLFFMIMEIGLAIDTVLICTAR